MRRFDEEMCDESRYQPKAYRENTPVKTYKRSIAMAMLPNDSHPGRGCSCESCLRAFPDAQMPQGARDTRCDVCGWTYGTHAPHCAEGDDERRPGEESVAIEDRRRAWPMADNE